MFNYLIYKCLNVYTFIYLYFRILNKFFGKCAIATLFFLRIPVSFLEGNRQTKTLLFTILYSKRHFIWIFYHTLEK